LVRAGALGASSLVCLACLLIAGPADATPPKPATPGYPEPVVQWGVQKGETCEDVAKALYGSPRYAVLLQRYNHVACKAGAPLAEGLTLVLPEKPTTLPDARLRSINPDVRARPGGGGWAPAAAGMPLFSNYNVNTLDQGRADVEFIDRTRVFLAPNTLVVIYGTASQTRVSKTAPAAVEVDAGEVKAVLAALRNEPVVVAVKGGGRVSAESRDTVVQRKGDRTTVAVFEGKAGVTSGGKMVEVPKNFGTRFVGATPPAPPRPLPPAPRWADGLGSTVLVAPGDPGTFDAAWIPEPKAAQYRIDLERDREKPDGGTEREVVSRTEVPATVTAFHGERLPIGGYHLTVRAIDKEEYLGIAAEHAFRFVEAKVEVGSGTVTPREVEVNPYGVLHLGASKELEMAIDDGPFGPMLDTIDLRRRAPHELRLRRRGSEAVDVVPVKYLDVKATVAVTPAPDRHGFTLRAQLSNVKGLDVTERVHPSARVRSPDGAHTVALAVSPDGDLSGTIELPGAGGANLPAVRADIVDYRGAVLGTGEYAPPADAPAAPPPERVRYPQIGPYTPLWQATPGADVLLFAPTPPDGAAVSVGMLHAANGWTAQGQVRASGSVGPVGLEAALHSDTADDKTADAAGWLGVRVRVLRLEGALLELSPSLRVGFPASSAGMPAQLEPAVALGGVAGRFTWLADVGGRLRLGDDNSMTSVPTGQGFILGGGTFDPLAWLRLHATLDAHLAVRDGGAKSALAGLGLGAEAGGPVYGGLSIHLSPWSDPGVGPFTAQLALGFRGTP
jgi:hypothetical protein